MAQRNSFPKTRAELVAANYKEPDERNARGRQPGGAALVDLSGFNSF